jgi:pyruvate/2-oxoglutarate dehydrogenase complex dihydrolipoamide acyltransferase (E2) component
MPMLGMNQNAGKILSWLKNRGDHVKVGDPVIEVETDKAVVEEEAQASGVLTEIRHVAGSEVPVGHVVAVTGEGATAPAPSNIAAPATLAKALEIESMVPEKPADVIEQAPRERLTEPRATDRLLISPKAREEAARRGLGLGQLSKLAKGPLSTWQTSTSFRRRLLHPRPRGSQPT